MTCAEAMALTHVERKEHLMCLYETRKRELEAMVHIVSEGGGKAETAQLGLQAVLELKELMSVVKKCIAMCDDVVKYEGKVFHSVHVNTRSAHSSNVQSRLQTPRKCNCRVNVVATIGHS